MVRLVTPLLLLLVAGCGYKGTLTSASTGDASTKEARQAEAAKVEEMLTPPPEAQPQRIDDILRRPTERTDDEFNLPPE